MSKYNSYDKKTTNKNWRILRPHPGSTPGLDLFFICSFLIFFFFCTYKLLHTMADNHYYHRRERQTVLFPSLVLVSMISFFISLPGKIGSGLVFPTSPNFLIYNFPILQEKISWWSNHNTQKLQDHPKSCSCFLTTKHTVPVTVRPNF